MHLVLTREPYDSYFKITLPNGHTEELETEETLAWFKARGADVDKFQKILDHVWNFYYAEIEFDNYKEPAIQRHRFAPKI